MNFYIENFLSALNGLPDNVILKNPLFSREHLDEFANRITNYMPMTQACDLIALFTSELCDVYLPSFLSQAVDIKIQNKKRKLENQAVVPLLPSMGQIESLIIFIVRFLRALRITSVSRNEIEKAFRTLFDQFIFPVLSTKLDDKNKHIDIMTYAALSLHHCLVDISPLYWKEVLTPEFITVLDNISSTDPKNKVRLQHVYLSTIKLQPANNETENNVDMIHKYIITVLSTIDYPKNAEISWTGHLVDVTKENFAISNSMLIIREWLDVVV
ncbi:5359_t:CDS:2, partial [Scutellospora calospora]